MEILILSGGAPVYVDFKTDKAICKGCGEEIYWAYTMKGKRMPIRKTQDGKWISHFSDCPKAKLFRRKE